MPEVKISSIRGLSIYMVRYGAQGESTVQYCGTIVVHGTVRGTARRMRSWYICMVRYGTVQIYYSGTWHMVQYVSHIAPMYGSVCTISPILKHGTVRYGTHGTVGTVHMVRLLRFCTVGTVHGTLGALVGRVQLLT